MPTAEPLPLCVGLLLSEWSEEQYRRGTPFSHRVLWGAQLFSPLSFPICLDQWPENKEQACIIVINAEGCVKSWGICCLLFHAPASSQKSAIAVICKRPGVRPASTPFGLPIAFENLFLNYCPWAAQHTHAHTRFFYLPFIENDADLQEEQIQPAFLFP